MYMMLLEGNRKQIFTSGLYCGLCFISKKTNYSNIKIYMPCTKLNEIHAFLTERKRKKQYSNVYEPEKKVSSDIRVMNAHYFVNTLLLGWQDGLAS